VTSTFVPAVAAFRALHASGCFVMPNPWDVGSAVFLARCGFKALASTSAGLAFSRGLPDSPTALSLEATLAHLRELAAATPLPLNADFQAGFADEPEGVEANVARCARTGVAGLFLESQLGGSVIPVGDLLGEAVQLPFGDHHCLDLLPVRLQVGGIRRHHLIEVGNEADSQLLLDLVVYGLHPACGFLFGHHPD